jgi:hypothetical protein
MAWGSRQRHDGPCDHGRPGVSRHGAAELLGRGLPRLLLPRLWHRLRSGSAIGPRWRVSSCSLPRSRRRSCGVVAVKVNNEHEEPRHSDWPNRHNNGCVLTAHRVRPLALHASDVRQVLVLIAFTRWTHALAPHAVPDHKPLASLPAVHAYARAARCLHPLSMHAGTICGSNLDGCTLVASHRSSVLSLLAVSSHSAHISPYTDKDALPNSSA